MSCQMSERAEANHVIPDFVLSVSIAPGQKCVTNFSRAFPFVNVHFSVHSVSVRDHVIVHACIVTGNQ